MSEQEIACHPLEQRRGPGTLDLPPQANQCPCVGPLASTQGLLTVGGHAQSHLCCGSCVWIQGRAVTMPKGMGYNRILQRADWVPGIPKTLMLKVLAVRRPSRSRWLSIHH